MLSAGVLKLSLCNSMAFAIILESVAAGFPLVVQVAELYVGVPAVEYFLDEYAGFTINIVGPAEGGGFNRYCAVCDCQVYGTWMHDVLGILCQDYDSHPSVRIGIVDVGYEIFDVLVVKEFDFLVTEVVLPGIRANPEQVYFTVPVCRIHEARGPAQAIASLRALRAVVILGLESYLRSEISVLTCKHFENLFHKRSSFL